MKVNLNIDLVAVCAVTWFIAMVVGMWTVVWELDTIRTDTEPQRVHHTFDQQPQQRQPFQRKSV